MRFYLRWWRRLSSQIWLALLMYPLPSFALPQGGVVTQGAATIQQENATKLNINQSTDRAVINWNSFSIGAPEWVNFQQPSSTSATLNRVTGNTPSSIAGKLTANGQIFLINPNGIMFLPTARVDVAGLVASTLNIQDSDFMRGVLRFEQMPGKPPASVVNQGLITVKEAGFAALVAPAVQNSGVISARLGKVVLASGTTVSLDFYGDGLLSVTVDPQLAGQITDIYGNKLNSLIDNQGNIIAPGGIVTLSAQAAGQIVDSVINTGGIIEAKYAENRNGVIVLSGGSKGVVAVNGELNVSGERGGRVEITGEKIALNGNALIDASGNKGGGIINIGGSFQGKGSLPNALETTVNAGAQIKADALTQGNGGKVIVWADGTTKFAGFISAKGGIISGDGGFAEVSGKENLLMTGFADLSAKNGKFGTLLLDPGSITIQDGTGINSGPNSFDDAFLITQLGLGNVTVATSAATNGNPETITIFGNTNIEWNTATTLTLNAGQSIFVNSGAVIKNTNTTTGFDAIVFNANTGGTTTGTFVGILSDNATLATQGGNIRLTGKAGNTGTNNVGIILNNSSITSTTGSIELVGTGGTTGGVGSGNRGISLQNGAKVTTAGGNIQFTGTGSEAGVYFSDTNSKIAVTAGNGSINLTGTGGFGIYQQNKAKVTTVSGDITYQGTGTTNPGIVLTGTTTPITSTTGNITLTADTMQLDNGSIQSTGKLLIQPLTPTTTIGLGGASGTLNLNTTELNKIQDGFSSITIGRTDGSGAITVGAHTFSDNLILQNPNGGGISINGALSVGTNNLTLKSGGTVTQSKAITANGLELLGSGTFTLTNTANNINILAGNTTNDISYTDSNSFSVTNINSTIGLKTSGNIALESGDTLTVGAGIDGLKSTAGTANLKATNDIILGTASNYGDVRGQKLVLTAGRDIIIDNTSYVQSDGSAGIDLFAGRDFKISSAIGSGSLLDSNGGSAPINIKVGQTFRLDSGAIAGAGVGANGGNITITADKMELISGNIGSTGELLIQPLNTSTTIGIGNGATGTLNLDNAEIGRLVDGFSKITIGRTDSTGAIDIRAAQFKDNVIIRTPVGAGNINLNGALSTGSGTETGAITLQAGNNIIGNTGSSITTQGKDIILNSDRDSTNGGAILLTNTNINSNNGNIILGGGADPLNNPAIGNSTLRSGIKLFGANLTAGMGNITFTGIGGNTGTDNYGIWQFNGSQVSTTTGNITYTGTGGNGTDANYGVILESANTKISTTDGEIKITGKGGGTGSDNYGIFQIDGAQVFTSGTGSITYTGTGGSGTDSNVGVYLLKTDTKVSTTNGAINIIGTGNGTGENNHGIFQDSGSRVFTTTGNITFEGKSGSGTNGNIGVFLGSPSTKVFTTNGAINITGTGNGTGARNYGILQALQVQVSTTTGNITYTGTGANGAEAIFTSIGSNIIGDNTSGKITFTSTNNPITLNNVTVKTTNNIIIDSPATVTQNTVGGLFANGLELLGNGSYTLNNVNNDINTLSANTTNSIAYTDTSGFDIGTVNTTNGIAIGANNLVLTAGGNVTQSEAITATLTTTVNAGASDIILNNINNDFSTVILTGNNATITDTNALNFGTTTITNNLTANTSGNITQSNALSITGLASFSAGTGNITLTDANNDFSAIALTGNNATITDKNALIFGTTTIANDLTANASGNITQSNALSINGLASFNAGSGDVILNNTNNDFSAIVLTGNNATITDKNALVLGATTITNNLSLFADGAVTQTNPIIANGLALLGKGSFDLQNPGNTITTIAANIKGDLKFVNSQTLTVGVVNPKGIEDANSVFLQVIAGDIILDQSITALNDITLVADSNFVNNVGAGALTTTTGRFLVYATSPDLNVQGWTVLGGSQQFNTTYPQVALFTGNGFLYKVGAPFVPGLPNLLTTEPVTFTLNFNDRQWRDLQIGSEDLVITEPLLCINGEQNTTSSSQQEVRDFELPLLANNAPYGSQPTRNFVTLQWQLGEFPACENNQASR